VTGDSTSTQRYAGALNDIAHCTTAEGKGKLCHNNNNNNNRVYYQDVNRNMLHSVQSHRNAQYTNYTNEAVHSLVYNKPIHISEETYV